jgi:hypothetical protein
MPKATKLVSVICISMNEKVKFKKIENNLSASKSEIGPMVGHSTSVLSQPFFSVHGPCCISNEKS